MSINTHPEAPYYDDYDPKKGYIQVLAKAGNYAQSREFTQIGTMFRDQMGNLGDAILTNGQIITGCDLVINGTEATIQPGRIYLDGMVHVIFEAISCTILGEGQETVGVKVEESLITAGEDETLRNPAVGTEGYMQEGASRIKQVVRAVANDPDAVNIYNLVDGEIVSEGPVDDGSLSTLNALLAKRTFDTSGNFKVEGLELMDKETDDGTSQIYVGAGTAYIYGYYVTFDSMRSVMLTIPTEFRSCLSEPKIYKLPTDKFYFTNNPVKAIKKVTSRVTITRDITRGVIGGGTDELPDQPVKEIISVVAGEKTYVAGEDYVLVGNSVDWSPFGEEPASGTTYTVTYVYLRTNIENTDYIVGGSGSEVFVQFLNTGTLPNENTEVLFDYEFYLSRIDTICLDRKSEISVIEGVSDREDLCVATENNDPTILTLGYVLSYANSTRKKIVNIFTKRLTQEELSKLRRRVDDVEENQAQKDLDDEAREGEDATELKGIYTDGFMGFTKADITHSEFDCSIDIDMCEMTLGYETGVVNLQINEDSSTAGVLGRIISSPYTDVEALKQPKATSKFLVNPYAVFDKNGILALNPAVDNWIDTNKIVINQAVTNAQTISLRLGRSTTYQYETRVNKSTSEKVTDSIIAFMRRITITITGSNFEPNEDNIECYFNGNRATIASPSIAGSSANTVKANAQGRFTCKIQVAANTPCGSVQVKMVGPLTNASAVYTANGTLRTITTTNITTTTKITLAIDPLAETFQFDTDTILTGIDLFFAAKDPSRSCIVQVRSVENGYPGTLCYAEEEVRPENINVNGNRPVATHINFSQPVYCMANTQYCFAILSDSNIYQVWQATMGEKDVVTGAKVSTQPYKDGVMFSSSNGLAWTAHQSSDITYTLYKAKYTGTGEIIFDDVSQIDFDKVLLAAETEDHKNAGIEWFYKVNESVVWEPIDTYVDREMKDEEGKAFSLKAKINVAQSTSPFIANDCINLVYFKNKLKGTYVSRMVEFNEVFNNIKVSVEFALPTGCTAKVFYMLPDVSEDWVQMSLEGETEKVDNEFNKFTYVAQGVSAKKYRVKIELETVNPLNRPRARKLMSILKY